MFGCGKQVHGCKKSTVCFLRNVDGLASPPALHPFSMSLYGTFARLDDFDAGHAALVLARSPQLVEVAQEFLLQAHPRARLPVCPHCACALALDLLFLRCVRCDWVERNRAFDLLWGLAFAGLHAHPPATEPPVHECPEQSAAEVFQRLFAPLFDALGNGWYELLRRMFFAAYVLVFLPEERVFFLPDCTCGHGAEKHVARNAERDFFAIPACVSGCACVYYQACSKHANTPL